MNVSLLRAKHLIISMLSHGSEAPDNPVPADSITPDRNAAESTLTHQTLRCESHS